jgi:hypothetical protein
VSELASASLSGDLSSVLGLGKRALAWAETENSAVLASAVVRADALVLGSLQRPATLAQRSALPQAPVHWRTTTGTEAHLSGATIYHALALPRVNALFSDAKARTLLNRNLRLMLRGYAAAGVPLRYFGTEVLALRGHPVALIGYDQSSSGAVLIEVLVGLEHALVLRPALRREPPKAMFEVLGATPDAEELAQRVMMASVERHGASLRDVSRELAGFEIAEGLEVAPAPPGAAPFPERAPSGVVPIPLGVVEASVEPTVRISGDLLVSRAALARVESAAAELRGRGQPFDVPLLAPLDDSPLDGARPADLLGALQAAEVAERG